MFQKISLPLLVTVMCILLGGVITLAYLNKGYLSQIFNKTKTGQKIEEVKITRTDYSQTARKTLDWIDKQRGSDGWYILERGCDFKTKTCDVVWNNEEGNKDGLIATWARFNFYNQTKDPKDLEIVKSDINKFYEKYPNGVDNALWICKITYEMWQSKLFDQETKDKLEKICFNSQFPTPEEVKERLKNKSKDMENFKIKNEIWNNWLDYVLVLRSFDVSYGYVSDMVAKYEWKKDKKYLTLANDYVRVLDDSYKKDVDMSANNSCLLGLSVVDLQQEMKGGEYNMDWTRKLFSIMNDDNDRRKYQTVVCGLFFKKLYSLSDDKVFLSGLEKNNKTLISGFLDMPDSFASKINDYAFFNTYNGSMSFPYKGVTENGVAVELIRD